MYEAACSHSRTNMVYFSLLLSTLVLLCIYCIFCVSSSTSTGSKRVAFCLATLLFFFHIIFYFIGSISISMAAFSMPVENLEFGRLCALMWHSRGDSVEKDSSIQFFHLCTLIVKVFYWLIWCFFNCHGVSSSTSFFVAFLSFLRFFCTRFLEQYPSLIAQYSLKLHQIHFEF